MSQIENQSPKVQKKHRIECYRCGRLGHISSDAKCPAISEECRKCHKVGHFAKKCRSKSKGKKKKKHVRSLDDKSDSENEEVTFSLPDKLSKTTVKVGSIPLSIIIDSGASCNVIDLKTWNNLNKQKDFKFISKAKQRRKYFLMALGKRYH